jgi:hypothetical protein
MSVGAGAGNWVGALRRFVQPPAAIEHCELCEHPIPADHAHLIEPDTRRLLCACQACALLFADRADSRYRAVPRGVRRLDDFALSDGEWAALRLPIDMAFFYSSSIDQRVVAMYPGPAGATESLLDLQAWHRLVAGNPGLAGLAPDVEALLVNRVGGQGEYYRVPIDHCYALVGLIRRHWRGLSGGTEAWQAIGDFFARLRDQPGTLRDWSHA